MLFLKIPCCCWWCFFWSHNVKHCIIAKVSFSISLTLSLKRLPFTSATAKMMTKSTSLYILNDLICHKITTSLAKTAATLFKNSCINLIITLAKKRERGRRAGEKNAHIHIGKLIYVNYRLNHYSRFGCCALPCPVLPDNRTGIYITVTATTTHTLSRSSNSSCGTARKNRQ